MARLFFIFSLCFILPVPMSRAYDNLALITGSWMIASYVASAITDGLIYGESKSQNYPLDTVNRLSAASFGTQIASLSVTLGLACLNCEMYDLAAGIIFLFGTMATYATSIAADIYILTNWDAAQSHSKHLPGMAISNLVFTMAGVMGGSLGFLLGYFKLKNAQVPNFL